MPTTRSKRKRLLNSPLGAMSRTLITQPSDSNGYWEVKTMKGSHPPFNDWFRHYTDLEGQKSYLYGGVEVDVETSPSCDFHVCDLKTMNWTNITDSLTFRQPYNPFSSINREQKYTKLPALLEPACTIMKLEGGTYFLIFGGYDAEKECTTSELIAVDLDSLEWFYIPVSGGSVANRTSAEIIAIRNHLFVFGGRKEPNNRAPPYASYSVIEYNPNVGTWSWELCDQPFPFSRTAHPLGYNIVATAIYAGKKILLTPGQISDARIDFSSNVIVLFHTENRTFHVASETIGDFPKNVLWYHAISLEHIPSFGRVKTPSSSAQIRSLGRNRGFEAAYSASLGPIDSPTPSVLLCAWVPHGEDEAAIELWQYFLPPEERIVCFKYCQKTYDLDEDFRSCVLIGSQLHLLGSRPAKAGDKSVWNIHVALPLVKNTI
ncbi:hypothetical protein BDQ12DRAFT_502421 [Crucibulum laeve]|uniref:Galactose oxidase n=1 Tax=Crucibulum laeve TaxID=68775 RepID=A0A5C3LHP6_9AGAR|nr:hypothetical protein BDQ12DRAFT_502421 [Crucibulum laeve]